MKQIFIYLLVLLCFACQSKKEYLIDGKVSTNANTSIETLGIKTTDTQFEFTTDDNGRFSVLIPSSEVAFCQLFGVATTGGNRWQFSTPIALLPNTPTHIDFALEDNRATITATDPNNRALQAFREWVSTEIRNLWHNMPAETEVTARLEAFPKEARRIIKELHPDKSTAAYLTTWANMEYLNIAHSLSRSKVPDAIASRMPDIPRTLDVPYWSLFYGSALYIMEYLQKSAPEPDAQIHLLQKEFRTPSIREKMSRRIIEHYVSQRPYSEENAAQLKALCATQPDKEHLMQQFRDKRFASPGAPLPEVVFEDREGKEHRLTEFAGKYIYIDLWASWCGPCVAEVPHLQKLEKELCRKDVVFVSISLDEKRANWEKKMEQLHMHGNQWIVRDKDFANMMNIKGIPHFLLYGKDGKLLYYNAPRPSHPAWKESLETIDTNDFVQSAK